MQPQFEGSVVMDELADPLTELMEALYLDPALSTWWTLLDLFSR